MFRFLGLALTTSEKLFSLLLFFSKFLSFKLKYFARDGSMLKLRIHFLFLMTSFLFSCFPPFQEKEKKDNLGLYLLAARVLNANNNSCSGLWAIDFNSNGYSCQSASLVASGTNVEIYEQTGLKAETNYTGFKYSSVATSFDSIIYPKLTTAFGNPSDIDGNKKVTIFVLDIGNGIGGYVDPVQFFGDDPTDPGFRSNQREIIYIDGNSLLALRKKDLSVNLPDTFLATLSHEFQHLIRMQHELGFKTVIRTLDDVTNKTFTFDDTWINEGTSEVASDIAGYGPQYSRMACFRGDPATDCVEGAAGYSLFTWKSSIRNYASAYTFMSYVYNVSGNTDTEKNAFIKNTVVGNSSRIRGNTLSNLMTLFQSAAKYNSSLLGTDNTGIYRRLYATFLSLAFNPGRYPGTSTLYIGTTNIGTMSALQTAYPLPTTLNPIYTYASNFGIVKGSTFLMDPSAFYRVSENSSTAPDSVDSVKVWNGNPGSFGPEFIIFNGRVDTTPIISTGSILSQKMNSEETKSVSIENENVKWQAPYSKTGELFCPHSFLLGQRAASSRFLK